jgi:hypothetical protein
VSPRNAWIHDVTLPTAAITTTSLQVAAHMLYRIANLDLPLPQIRLATDMPI